VPAVGVFFTPLMLEAAFKFQDDRRRISYRRFVAPSFNDIRLTLNTAQLMSLVRHGPVELITFDGDVTLYDDGQALVPTDFVIARILQLLSRGIKVGIITAAGYTDASRYYERLFGLLEAIKAATGRSEIVDPMLIVIGGESNYLYEFDRSAQHLLKPISRSVWMLEEMKAWTEADIAALLDVAEGALRECIENLGLSAEILRKERAVGIIQDGKPGARRFTREQLEETVLVTQQIVEMSLAGKRLPFCAFNGMYKLCVVRSVLAASLVCGSSIPPMSVLSPNITDSCLTKAVAMSSSTSAIRHGASWHAGTISAALTGARRSTSATSSYRPEPMISRSASNLFFSMTWLRL
jgi:hypothetical protein